MMRVKSCQADLSVNIITCSGVNTRGGRTEGRKVVIETQVRKAEDKNVGFTVKCENEKFMEERKTFMNPKASPPIV